MAEITVSRPAQQPRRHSPWPGRFLIRLALIVVATALVMSVVVTVVDPLPSPAPTAPTILEPVAQPVQQVPAMVTLVKVYVEWTQIGVAHNGAEVIALGIPWDELIYVPVEVVENLPPGVTGIAGGIPTKRETIILITLAQTEPWVYTYWKGSEIPIEYAPKPWVYTQRGK